MRSLHFSFHGIEMKSLTILLYFQKDAQRINVMPKSQRRTSDQHQALVELQSNRPSKRLCPQQDLDPRSSSPEPDDTFQDSDYEENFSDPDVASTASNNKDLAPSEYDEQPLLLMNNEGSSETEVFPYLLIVFLI